MKEACESFMNLSFDLIFKKVFTEEIFPNGVTEIVESEMRRLDIKAKYTLQDIKNVIDSIHSRFMSYLFKLPGDYQGYNDADDLDEDSTESMNGQVRPTVWIVTRFIEEFKKEEARFSTSKKL